MCVTSKCQLMVLELVSPRMDVFSTREKAPKLEKLQTWVSILTLQCSILIVWCIHVDMVTAVLHTPDVRNFFLQVLF